MLWIFDGIFELQKLWKLSHLYFLCHLQEIFQHISFCKLHWSVCIECGGCFSEKSFHHHSSSFLTRAPLSEFNSNFQFISTWNTCLLLKPFKIPFFPCVFPWFWANQWCNTGKYILNPWPLTFILSSNIPQKSNIEKGQKRDLCRLDIGGTLEHLLF